MYVHIGEDVLVRTSEIVAILDKQSVHLGEIRSRKEISPTSSHLADKNVKSVVITTKSVYLSSIASATLKKKSQLSSFQELNNESFTNLFNGYHIK